MKKMKKQKKAAVEMSLNLIIMLVIGLTILGLIIAFVTSFLGQAEDSVTGKLTEDDKTKVEQVLREEGNFAFLSSTLALEKGETGKLYVKIRDVGSSDLSLSGGPVSDSGDFRVSITSSNGEDSGGEGNDQINIKSPPINLKQGDEEGYPLIVEIGKEVPVDSYFAEFTITIDDEEYTELVTIEVE